MMPHPGSGRRPAISSDPFAVFVGTGIDFDLVAVLDKSGTAISKPVAVLAGFMTLPEVSPLTAGSVVTSRTTEVGNSTEMALPS